MGEAGLDGVPSQEFWAMARDFDQQFLQPNGFEFGCYSDFFDSEVIPAELKLKAKKYLKQMIDVGVNDDLYFHAVIKCAKIVGKTPAMKQRIQQGFLVNGKFNQDFCRFVLEQGDDDEMRFALDAFFQHTTLYSPERLVPLLLHGNKIKNIAQEIRAAAKKYSKEHCLLFETKKDDAFSRLPLIAEMNAAVEIKNMNYDLVVGILRSCVSLTTPLEMLGQEVRYVECIRGPRSAKKPVWIGRGRGGMIPIRHANRVLICENDAISGNTLRTVQPLIQAVLEPKVIDICFHKASSLESSKEVARGLGFYTKVFSVMDVGFEHFFDNLKTLQTAAKK